MALRPFAGHSGNVETEPVSTRKIIKNPAEIIINACALMSYWAGLYGPEMHGKILEGVKTLLSCVHWASAPPRRSLPRLLPSTTQAQASGEDTSDDEE